MKTTIKRVKQIKFTEQEQKILRSLQIRYLVKDSAFDDYEAQQAINILIDINPEKQEHKDFIMELIKELKR